MYFSTVVVYDIVHVPTRRGTSSRYLRYISSTCTQYLRYIRTVATSWLLAVGSYSQIEFIQFGTVPGSTWQRTYM